MSTLSIILIVYFVVAIAIMSIVIYRRQHDPRPWSDLIEKKPLWKIVLPFPIYPIAGIFYVLIQAIDPQERRNREAKKHLKTKDDFEKEYAELKVDKVDIEDGLDDTLQKNASFCMANGLLNRDLLSFFSMLDDNVSQVLYDEKLFDKITGKSNVEQYWSKWLKRQADNGLTHKYKIVKAKYFSTEALEILFYNGEKRYCGVMIVVFWFNSQNRIQNILFSAEPVYYTHFLENKQKLLSTLESLSSDHVASDFERGRHLPCCECGTDSEKLIWYGYRYIAYGGQVSFCPKCKDIVEHYCTTHFYVDYWTEHFPMGDNIDYIENVLNTNDVLDEPEEPAVLRAPGRVFLERIGDVLSQCEKLIEGSEEDQLLYAANNGVYEAYNNLAIKLLGKDTEKAIEYFKLAADHGVANSMLNLSLWYYAGHEMSQFINYTHLAAKAGNIIGLYNDAVTWHSAVFGGAPQIDRAEKLYRAAIEECLNQIYDEDENQKPKDDFCDYVLQYAYYGLGLLYYRDFGEYKKYNLNLYFGKEEEFAVMLKAYAYLNECPKQDNKVRYLKACIYKRILEMQKGVDTDEIKDKQDYDDLPF